MKQEEIQLLLLDLSARLQYRTMVKCNTDGRHEFDEELSVMHIMNFYQFEVKPYLRPLSSMTKKETKELFKEIGFKFTCNICGIPARYNYEFAKQIKGIPTITNVDFIKVIDWLNAHHFDYRGLIEKGLAIEVTKNNNPYKDYECNIK